MTIIIAMMRIYRVGVKYRDAKRAKSKDVKIPSYKVSGRSVSSCRWGSDPTQFISEEAELKVY